MDVLNRFLLMLKEAAKGEPGETPAEQKALVKRHKQRFEASIRQEKSKRKELKQDRNKGGIPDLY